MGLTRKRNYVMIEMEVEISTMEMLKMMLSTPEVMLRLIPMDV